MAKSIEHKRIPRLPGDTFLILGRVEKMQFGVGHHKVTTYTREEAEKIESYCGLRADWVIVVGEYDSEWADNVLKPLMSALTEKEIQDYQRIKELPATRPVIWHVPGLMEITDYSI